MSLLAVFDKALLKFIHTKCVTNPKIPKAVKVSKCLGLEKQEFEQNGKDTFASRGTRAKASVDR